MNFKTITSISLLLLILFPLTATEKIGKGIHLGTDIYIESSSEDFLAEYYNLGAKVRLNYNPIESLCFKFKLQAEPDAVELDELYTKYSFPNRSSLQFGMYENDLLLEDEMNSVESPYSEDSFLRNRLETMGWYSNAGLGLRYFTPLGEESHWSVTGSAYYTSAMSTAQFILKMNYSFKNSNMGFTSSYMADPHTYSAEFNYYFFNTFVGNLDIESPWNYKLDLAFGKNIGDPGGNNHFPEGAVTDSHFAGIDAYFSYNKDLSEESGKNIWTPTIGLGYVIHDLSIPESSTTDLRLGSRFSINKMFYIHSDLGLRSNIYYDPDLTTGMEILWAVSSRFRY